MAYIYKIINQINGKIYIGKTEFSIEECFKEHCKDAFRERNEKRPLYAAMRKYGIKNFFIELIEETNSPIEREMFWIEYFSSFKNGYNATLGGDGKKYLDYDVICATYEKIQNIKKTAELCNCSSDSVTNILNQRNIPIKNISEIMKKEYGKIIHQYTLSGDYVQTFATLTDAATWLKENNYTQAQAKDLKGVFSHIRDCANGKRKTAYKFAWKF